MAYKYKILAVDDDTKLLALLADFFQQHNFIVETTTSNQAALSIFNEKKIDLVILDLELHNESGSNLCKSIRQKNNVPILMLTCSDNDKDRLLCFEHGVDDYITKPCSTEVLLAHVNAILRRTYPQRSHITIYQFLGWQLNTDKHRLSNPQGKTVPLTTGLYNLLLAFVENPQRTLTRHQLLDTVTGYTEDPFARGIDIQLTRLRKKLQDDSKQPTFIKTIRNKGYMFLPKITFEFIQDH